MNNKFIISDFYKNKLLGFILNDYGLDRIVNLKQNSVFENIYCGKIKDIVKNIHAAFVEFDDNKIGYLSLANMEEVRQGDRVLVQVSGDKIKTKDYSLTTQYVLKSKCLILKKGSHEISISKKIKEKEQRETLKSILKEFVSDDYGFIVRTNAVNFTEEEIRYIAGNLIDEYRTIEKKFHYVIDKAPIKKQSVIIKNSVEFLDKYCGDILTDNKNVWKELLEYNIDCTYNTEDKVSLCNKYSLEKYIREALSQKVWLKSGAYLIIEQTEAMTVIDVNSGKSEIRGNRLETLKKINKEAAKVIASQLKIRNLSGIIIVDFINMNSASDYEELKTEMELCVMNDYVKCNIIGFTNLGLMEITRKKAEKPLSEILS